MDIGRELQQRKEFRDILFELAESQDILKEPSKRSEMYLRFENLYHNQDNQSEKFRHFYSDIFTVLTQVQQDSSKGDINILGQNLALLRSGYETKNVDKNGKLIDVSNSIKKIYDHVSLDIARMSYSDNSARVASGAQAVEELKTKVNDAKSASDNLEGQLKEVKQKLENSQKEYITILGIFASIVLAFTGGIVFSTSVLENMHNVSIYKAILVCLTIGFVLVNTVNILLEFIRDINGINKEKGSKSTIYKFNILIIVFVGLTVLAMKCHLFSPEVFHIVEFISSS